MAESGTKRVVIAAVADLFFTSKIGAAAAHADVVLMQAVDARQLARTLATVIPDLVIFDLNCAECEPMAFVRRIRSDPRFEKTRVLGYLSHVQKELEREAKEAGFKEVVSRSKFSADLVNILATDSTAGP